MSNFLSGQASLWVQVYGPNTLPQYLGCHQLGDVAEPKGDETLLYCPDPSAMNKFSVKNSFTGEPGVVTTSMETDISKTADYMELLGDCRVPIYIHKASCGRRDVFTNYDRSFILRQAKVTNRGLSNLAASSPDAMDQSKQTFDLAARSLTRVFNLQPLRTSITSPGGLTGITVCGENRCEDDCGAVQYVQDYLFVAQKLLGASSAANAEVMASINGGVWAPTTTDPFADGLDIQGIVCFKMGTNILRIVVACGTTAPGHMQIAYSDDYGVTWTTVDVGTVDGEYCANGHALFSLDRYHMWLGSDGGNIYFSDDAGLTWDLQEPATISATDVIGISFVSPNIGFAVYTGGQIAKTTDMGVTWSAATISGATTTTDIHAISAYFVWVTGANGCWYTHDAGVTWAQRNSYAIGAIDFLDELVGIIAGSGASANIYETINGGYDWSPMPALSNAGYTDVVMVHPSLAYAVGNVSGGLGLLATMTPIP